MSDGTIQDSRRPTSPQWGYLKVKNPNKLKGSDPNQNDDWNEYALFITKKDKTKEEVIEIYTAIQDELPSMVKNIEDFLRLDQIFGNIQ